MRVLASLTGALLFASPASASELALTLTTSAGKPVGY